MSRKNGQVKMTKAPTPKEPEQGTDGLLADAHFDAAVTRSRSQSTIYDGRRGEADMNDGYLNVNEHTSDTDR